MFKMFLPEFHGIEFYRFRLFHRKKKPVIDFSQKKTLPVSVKKPSNRHSRKKSAAWCIPARTLARLAQLAHLGAAFGIRGFLQIFDGNRLPQVRISKPSNAGVVAGSREFLPGRRPCMEPSPNRAFGSGQLSLGDKRLSFCFNAAFCTNDGTTDVGAGKVKREREKKREREM